MEGGGSVNSRSASRSADNPGLIIIVYGARPLSGNRFKRVRGQQLELIVNLKNSPQAGASLNLTFLEVVGGHKLGVGDGISLQLLRGLGRSPPVHFG